MVTLLVLLWEIIAQINGQGSLIDYFDDSYTEQLMRFKELQVFCAHELGVKPLQMDQFKDILCQLSQHDVTYLNVKCLQM